MIWVTIPSRLEFQQTRKIGELQLPIQRAPSMFNPNSPRTARSMFATAVAALALFSVPLFGQTAPRTGNTALAGVPEDWSSHHVVFADPGTEEAAIQAGRHDVWLRTVNDPRYIMQQIRRKDIVRGPAATGPVQFLQTHFAHSQPPAATALHKLPKPKNTIQNDWSVNLTTNSVMPNTY